MVASDLARAALLVTIPAAALLNLLRIEQLYIVAALAGALDIFFDVAYQSYLPALVDREHVLEGNSKLGATESLAEIGGSALTGTLVQILSAPVTILIDAISFLFSVVSVLLIRKPEPLPIPRNERSSVRREIVEGLQVVAGNPVLRALASGAGTLAFFGSFFGSLYALYAIRVLAIEPAVLGFLIASGGVGALIGALLAGRVTHRLSLGTTLVGSLALTGAMHVFVPLASLGPKWLAVAFMFISQIGGDMVRTVFFINELSLRQAITPDRLLGRTNASMSFMVGGVATFGLLAGGLLGETIGVLPGVIVAALGSSLAFLWLVFSPVRALRRQSDVSPVA